MDPDDLLIQASRAGTNFVQWNDVEVAEGIAERAGHLPRAHLELAHAYIHEDDADPRVLQQFQEAARLAPSSSAPARAASRMPRQPRSSSARV